MKFKFKENDMVVFVNKDKSHCGLTVGSVYKVWGILEADVGVQVLKIRDDNDYINYYRADCFRLAPKFKNGDLVKCINNQGMILTIGSTYKVLDSSEDYVHVLNDDGVMSRYFVERFELADKKEMKFNLTIEEDNIADFLYKLENAYNIVSEVAKTEKAYEEAYLKLEALLNDKTGSSGLF